MKSLPLRRKATLAVVPAVLGSPEDVGGHLSVGGRGIVRIVGKFVEKSWKIRKN
jgi:hypothetical protein